MIKVSVIMPVYNGELYIRQAITSVLRQSLHDLELLVIDDGSDDMTYDIVQNLMRCDGRLKLLCQNHEGAGIARNKGLSEAKGRYIAFCDADDYFLDADALERMVEACEQHGVSICGSYQKILEHGRINDSPLLKEFVITDVTGRCAFFEELQNDFDYQSFIFEKKLLEENEITFPDYLRYQDPPFFVRAMVAAKKFWIVPTYLYCYRNGHQDLSVIDKNIKFVLMGILDNLEIALKYAYEKLYERLVEERLNGIYYGNILKNMSDDVVTLLNAIVETGKKYKRSIELRAFSDASQYKACCELIGKEDAIYELENTRNQSFEIWRKTALLAVRGIGLADILTEMGYKEIYVYGAGEIGQMLLSAIAGKIAVKAVLDKTMKNQRDIANDDVPVVVTPAAAFQEISYGLIKAGVRRERIYSIHTMLSLAFRYCMCGRTNLRDRKHFLITGAQFANKGAQSMLFTAASELRKRFKDAIIWYLPLDADRYTKAVQEKYDFMFLLDGFDLKSQVYEILPQLAAIIDVSGYALSSYWEHAWYMRILRMAYRYDIPLYLMPQSFGPFDFEEEKQKELRVYLPFARQIYVRERAAFEQMKALYNLKNIALAKDMVLQNKEIDGRYLYAVPREKIKGKKLTTKPNVAVIPNIRNYEFGIRERILAVYQRIIRALLDKGKHVYIVPHSDDSVACADIYRMFQENPAVYLIEEEMDCVEFGAFTKNFQYLIASRFHAIVHGYKNGVPSIAIGWADKYRELLDSFSQGDYLFDIRKGLDVERMMAALDKMDGSFAAESKTIGIILPRMQADNCFDRLQKSLGG